MIYGTRGLAFGHANVSQSLHSARLIELSRCRGIEACCETGSSMGALMVDGLLGMIIPMQSDKR
jgi:hypothetical protein